MPISHDEVRRHPLWREQVAAPARARTARRSARIVLLVVLVGLLAFFGALAVVRAVSRSP